MKNALFYSAILVLFIPLFATAQVEDYKMVDDSTIVALPDTMFYRFDEGVMTFTRPNNSVKEIPFFSGTLINRVGGVRHNGNTSGRVQKKEYLDWLKLEKEREIREIEGVIKDLENRKQRKEALVEEIDRVRR